MVQYSADMLFLNNNLDSEASAEPKQDNVAPLVLDSPRLYVNDV